MVPLELVLRVGNEPPSRGTCPLIAGGRWPDHGEVILTKRSREVRASCSFLNPVKKEPGQCQKSRWCRSSGAGMISVLSLGAPRWSFVAGGRRPTVGTSPSSTS